MIAEIAVATFIAFGAATHVTTNKLEDINHKNEIRSLERFEYRPTMKSAFGVPETKPKGQRALTIKDLK